MYASNKLHAAIAPSAGGKIIDAYVYSDPGDAEYFANFPMHSATSKIAPVANTYASHVPFPASAHTSGIVAAGVVVGAIVDTDCASVSIGDNTSRRNPYPAAVFSVCVKIFSRTRRIAAPVPTAAAPFRFPSKIPHTAPTAFPLPTNPPHTPPELVQTHPPPPTNSVLAKTHVLLPSLPSPSTPHT